MHKLIALGSLVGLLSACSPVGAGDYVVYRVSFAATNGDDIDAGCFGGTVPLDAREDESDFRSANTFAVYKAGDFYYLENGTEVMEGTRDGKTFTFEAERVNRDYQTNEAADGFTERTTETEISYTVSGASITGSAQELIEQTCSGEFCDPEDIFSCETEGTFIGSEIKDADLIYGWQDAD